MIFISKMSHKLTEGVKCIILDLVSSGHSTVKISRIMEDTFKFKISRQGVHDFLLRHNSPPKRKTVPRKFTDLHRQILNMWLKENKDWTARDLQRKFVTELKVKFSLSVIKLHRRAMNWTMKRKKYCQFISNKNKQFRVEWCLEKLSCGDTFQDVIFVDESNVELSSTGRLSFYQVGSSISKVPSRAAKPKHSYTVTSLFKSNSLITY